MSLCFGIWVRNVSATTSGGLINLQAILLIGLAVGKIKPAESDTRSRPKSAPESLDTAGGGIGQHDVVTQAEGFDPRNLLFKLIPVDFSVLSSAE